MTYSMIPLDQMSATLPLYLYTEGASLNHCGSSTMLDLQAMTDARTHVSKVVQLDRQNSWLVNM